MEGSSVIKKNIYIYIIHTSFLPNQHLPTTKTHKKNKDKNKEHPEYDKNQSISVIYFINRRKILEVPLGQQNHKTYQGNL